ncbi:hypothetical protein ACFQ2C_13780 [Sphingobacterium daejeonense]|uniref:Apea-like HEPN domain-containing protein n=1 Tax=Sphingobacterium daejeonense TaxID=371142 RepID=A0ABW3RPS1_9SPHI
MKYFTEPNGKFVIKVPTEWQYKNIAVGQDEVSPFSFELYENSIGAFQLSCYSDQEQPINKSVPVQKFDANKLDFINQRMDGGGFNIHLWYAVVEDHMVMAKYIYDTSKQDNPEVKTELEKAELVMTTFELISPNKRNLALEFDRYEKFMVSLAASFDLKNRAIQNKSVIELMIIIANQIDAYLRMAIVMKKQLQEKTNRIDIALLYQGETDTPIMERKIYKQAKDLRIISQDIFDKLDRLYTERNKVVHRYIISEFKTVYLYEIVYEYETVCETVRQSLKVVEDLQFTEGIGVHGNGRHPDEEPTEQDVNMLYSQVNDKHLIRDLFREIKK